MATPDIRARVIACCRCYCLRISRQLLRLIELLSHRQAGRCRRSRRGARGGGDGLGEANRAASYGDTAVARLAIKAANQRFANACDKPIGRCARRNKRLMTAATTTLPIPGFSFSVLRRVN